MPPPVDDHQCGWRDYALEIEAKLQVVTGKLEAIERRLFGKKTEKLPPPVPKPNGPRSSEQREQTKATRKAKAQAKQELPTDTIAVPVPDDKRCCPRCKPGELRPVGAGTSTVIYDYVEAHFRRRQYVRETLACRCTRSPGGPRTELDRATLARRLLTS